ncbi:hypothetical protein C7271_05130 [filamentous cyanobacterium CCP5]|nr:hypothetical protein C7271_05130 [filamentous cyanobacterium CCP5]
MDHRSISVAVGVGAGIGLALPVQAHKTEVSGDVAGTWHLEPNHSPKAGEPARVWVALTQQGGRVIPLEQCDCQLTVYRSTDPTPVLEPPLAAVSPESYQSIPGADVTFPEVGEYRLTLIGSPQAGAAFMPFELSYTTVVAAGRGSQPTSQPEVAPPETAAESQTSSAVPQAPPASLNETPAGAGWLVALGIGVAIATLAATLFLRQRKVSE